jgi:hypothetical protein
MGIARKLAAVAFLASIFCSILLIDRDPELWWWRYEKEAWSQYFNKWHDVPVFGPDGRWNVMRDFDHNAHWKWQLEEIERLYGPNGVLNHPDMDSKVGRE